MLPLNVFLIDWQSYLFKIEKESCKTGSKAPCVMRRSRNYFAEAGGQEEGWGTSASVSSLLERGKHTGWNHRNPEPLSEIKGSVHRAPTMLAASSRDTPAPMRPCDPGAEATVVMGSLTPGCTMNSFHAWCFGG